MVKLVVQVTGTDAATGAEVELLRVESNEYNPEQLVRDCVLQIMSGKPQERINFTKSGTLQVGVELFSDGTDSVRPSFHLDADVIRALAEADAELDFDPYVYS